MYNRGGGGMSESDRRREQLLQWMAAHDRTLPKHVSRTPKVRAPFPTGPYPGAINYPKRPV